MTYYYTCDECDWAGPFADAHDHYKATGHGAFSRRDNTTEAVATERVVENHHHHYHRPSYPRPWCDHSFTWMATIPPTHCPKCGAWLRGNNALWPNHLTWTINSGGFTTNPNNAISSTIASSSTIWNGQDGPDAPGLPAKL